MANIAFLLLTITCVAATYHVQLDKIRSYQISNSSSAINGLYSLIHNNPKSTTRSSPRASSRTVRTPKSRETTSRASFREICYELQNQKADTYLIVTLLYETGNTKWEIVAREFGTGKINIIYSIQMNNNNTFPTTSDRWTCHKNIRLKPNNPTIQRSSNQILIDQLDVVNTEYASLHQLFQEYNESLIIINTEYASLYQLFQEYNKSLIITQNTLLQEQQKTDKLLAQNDEQQNKIRQFKSENERLFVSNQHYNATLIEMETRLIDYNHTQTTLLHEQKQKHVLLAKINQTLKEIDKLNAHKKQLETRYQKLLCNHQNDSNTSYNQLLLLYQKEIERNVNLSQQILNFDRTLLAYGVGNITVQYQSQQILTTNKFNMISWGKVIVLCILIFITLCMCYRNNKQEGEVVSIERHIIQNRVNIHET